MNAPLDLKLRKPEFLRWVQEQTGGRYELKAGSVIMQAGTTRGHWRIYSRFIVEIQKQLDSMKWEVGGTDLAVEIGETVRYPDVLVEAAGRDGRALSTTEPSLLVEVLSPSSVGTDMTEKPAEYASIPSLEAYIVASQDEPIVWLWLRRDPAGGTLGDMPQRPLELAGRNALIEVPRLGLSLPLASIYRGIGTP
ncbi:MAG: Uma2 family endonuclease [Alphaproteobacteria bacterium]|nr:Uma2 family endonuclease [Alphaproteobacteria bacterium]